MLIIRLLSILSLFFLNSCADSPTKPSGSEETLRSDKEVKVKAKIQQKEITASIDPDVLFTLLTAELAGQRGQYEIALEGYLTAAKQVHDPKFAERAVMIAMYMKNSAKTKEALDLWLNQDSKNLSARKIAALLALREGNKAVASEHINAMLVFDPAGFEATLLELAGVLEKEGRINIVGDVLNDLSMQHPDRAEIYFLQSILAMQKKEKNNAEINIQKALKLKPDWDKAIMFKAQIAIFSGDLEGAKLELNKATIKYPENNKIKKMYAQVLIKKEEYKEAIEVYQKVIAADPKDLESQFAEGLVDLQLEHYQRAEEIFKRLSEDPESRYQAYFYLGKAEEKQGNIKKALGWYDKVLDGPFMFESSISAITLLQKDKQLDEASARLGVLQEKFPKQRIKLLLASVDLYSQQKKYDEAFNLLTKALMDYPDQKELLYARALIAERINKIDIVEIDLKKILAVEPNNVEALNALGYTLLSNPARYVDAEKYLKKALELEPEEAIIIDSYGWLQFKLGNAEQALVYLQKAYKKQQENEIAAHLAEVLWALDRKEDAIKIYNGAIKRAQDDEYLRDFQQRIMSGKQ